MNSSSLIKVIAAFVTGVLVALVGAITYMKLADRSPSEPVIQSAAVAAAPRVQQRPEVSAPENALPPSSTPDQPRARRMRPDTLSQVGHKFKHQPSEQVTAEIPDSNVARSQPPAPEPPVQQESRAPANVPQPDVPAPQVPARQPQTVTLEQGMSLVVRLNEAISTAHNSTGDTFRGTLELPITINGFIIAERGSKVLGRIVNAERPGRVQGLADLTLAVTELNTSDGQRVEVQTSSFEKKGASSARRDTAKVAGGAALGAIIGAIAGGGKGAGIGAGVGGAAGAGDVLLTHGKDVAIPNETVLTFRLSAPVTVTEHLN